MSSVLLTGVSLTHAAVWYAFASVATWQLVEYVGGVLRTWLAAGWHSQAGQGDAAEEGTEQRSEKTALLHTSTGEPLIVVLGLVVSAS